MDIHDSIKAKRERESQQRSGAKRIKFEEEEKREARKERGRRKRKEKKNNFFYTVINVHVVDRRHSHKS